jgi:hypothetical protein
MGLMGFRTPNIDRVAKEGMIFTDYYAEQSCTAGRASADRLLLHSGRRPRPFRHCRGAYAGIAQTAAGADRSRRSVYRPYWNGGSVLHHAQEPNIQPALITYVAAFVPEGMGAKFNPHVATGLASKEYLDKMLAQPFEAFTFSPAGASVYQLGEFGTASKKLKDLDLKL